jgi:diguanylate cyclase (GGDEF)-like protein
VFQLAVIDQPRVWPAHWALPAFQLVHLPTLSQLPLEARVDTVALVQPRTDEVDRAWDELDRRDRFGSVTRLLVARSDTDGLPELLRRHRFDGFLDLAWPESLAEAGIRMAMGHVELGRTMVDIQRVVIEESRHETASLYELAHHDGLTHLFNHRYFAELMEREHHRSVRRGESYALVFIDLDDLKQLNTRYGHAGGSLALSELARIIAASTRASDVAVRMGGDEFAVFLAGCDQQRGTEFAHRLCAKLREHRIELDGERLCVTVSCGVAAYPEDGDAYAELLKLADRALLRAKSQGKDRAVHAVREHFITREMRKA